MNKEIEEMAKDINERIACCGYVEDCEPIELAEALYNAGYRKIVWHKVADGDLPKVTMHTIIYYKSELGFTDYRTDLFWDGRFVNFGEQVIAWTELPKYEGEE